ncbi:MAG TPA: nuclear transport factor 2 family protein [Jatrophihabitantaceae bacterium]|jgi:hypothetical protein
MTSTHSKRARDNVAEIGERYVEAVRRGDAAAVLDLLAPGAVFRSPFSTWTGTALPRVYRARAGAFQRLRVDAVVSDHRRVVVVLWRAEVNEISVEASEVLSFTDDPRIGRVDVYLRPADALPAVYQAMVHAWPTATDHQVPRRP